MKKIILLFVFTIINLSILYSQFFSLTETVKQTKRTSISIELFDTSFKSDPILLGSGFLSKKGGIYYGITNYHVISEAIQEKDRILVIGVNIEKRKQYASYKSILIDEKSDIAILEFGHLFYLENRNIVDSALAEPVFVGVSMFATNDEIVEGLSVVLIGYPLGLGRTYTGNEPISRIGIVAQSVNENKNTFLIDGIASRGNSGSPIFNAQNNKFLGIVSGGPSDLIMAFDENRNLIASLPYNSGISICITAQKILDLINSIK